MGDEDDDTIIGRMADHPTLLQRPIAIKDGKAALGRPASNILQLLD
ncbi:MAG: ArsC/Spx/MgsR family protein [Myxococcota bacterium]|nr:ArsC/Spx/MgsR family protein [Myxococcota bacterium]